MEGKCAIITGSTSGIGYGIAHQLALQGCNLVINGTREDASTIVSQLQKDNIKVIYCQADFSHPENAAKKIVQSAIDSFGKIDILVNNAGIQHVSRVEEFPSELWDKLLATNLTSCFHTIKLALPHMKKNHNQWGRIINISSVHGVVASVNKCAYVAAKHGLNGLTKVVALEVAADTQITCNAICPGWVHTSLVQTQIEVYHSSMLHIVIILIG